MITNATKSVFITFMAFLLLKVLLMLGQTINMFGRSYRFSEKLLLFFKKERKEKML
jgi:hypothetical protein